MTVVIRHGRLTGAAAFAWPDASNTGPTGELETYAGTNTISSDGAIIQNVTYSGSGLTVTGNNVTISNCQINCTGAQAITVTGTNCTIEDCEIVKMPNLTTPTWAIQGAAIVRFCDISGYQVGILVGTSGDINHNYIHDLLVDSDNVGIYATGGQDGVSIEDNTVTLPGFAIGVLLVNYDGAVTDVIVSHNYLAAPNEGPPLYVSEEGAAGVVDDITILNNHLEASDNGYISILVVDQSSFFVEGNVDALTGDPV